MSARNVRTMSGEPQLSISYRLHTFVVYTPEGLALPKDHQTLLSHRCTSPEHQRRREDMQLPLMTNLCLCFHGCTCNPTQICDGRAIDMLGCSLLVTLKVNHHTSSSTLRLFSSCCANMQSPQQIVSVRWKRTSKILQKETTRHKVKQTIQKNRYGE